MEQTVRVISLNVHFWKDAEYVPNVESVREFVAEWTPHLLALQEVTDEDILKHAIGDNYDGFYGKASASYFANAVAARKHPLISVVSRENRQFRPDMARDDDPLYGSEIRATCKFRLSTTIPRLPQLDFFCLHLDHIDEKTRLAQLHRLWRAVDQAVPHIIAGDFNALCQSDYSEAYLTLVAEERERNRWESPHFTVTSEILSKGYVDVFRRLNPTLKDENVVTNRFETRIDYIFVSASLAELIDWDSSECLIVARPDISDHLPLAADLVFKQIA